MFIYLINWKFIGFITVLVQMLNISTLILKVWYITLSQQEAMQNEENRFQISRTLIASFFGAFPIFHINSQYKKTQNGIFGFIFHISE